ncbi:MAG: zinc-binding dehydrogenase, partial [Bradymonadaceae bacterium]
VIQLCRLFDSPVFATASRPKLDFLRNLGVERAIDRKNEDFVEILAEATDGAGADIIIDPVAGDYLPRNIEVLADRGRLVLIGLLGGTSGQLPM